MKTLVLATAVMLAAVRCPAAELEGRQMTAREMRAAAAWILEAGCYDVEMEGTMSMKGMDATIVFANRALGDRYSDSRVGILGMQLETLCDGDSLWTYNHFAKTYSVEAWRGMNVPRAGPVPVAGNLTPPFAFDVITDLLAPAATPGHEEQFYAYVGDDSVVVAGQAIACEMWVIAQDSTLAARVWVDPVRHLQLRDDVVMRDPAGNVMKVSSRITRLQIDHGLQPADFAFTAPAGYRRVASSSKLYVERSLEGQTPADFTLTDFAGGSVSTRDWRGKVVVVDYWGPHCPPCAKEFGHLQELRAEYGDDVVFVGITDSDRQNVERFLARNPVTLPVWLDEKGELRDAYRVTYIPALYILDAAGTVREHFVGLQDSATLRDALQRLGASPRKD